MAEVDDIDVADVVIVVAIMVVMMAIAMVVLLVVVVVMLMAVAVMLLEFAPRVRDRHRMAEMKGSVTLAARAE